MSALRTRRKRRSLATDRGAVEAISREYDDNRLRVDEPLENILPGQDLAHGWADVGYRDESDIEPAVEFADADLAGDDISVPVIPKQANEFMCSRCFLIHHTSRLASSKGDQLICTDCA
jgi:hypothetical protein